MVNALQRWSPERLETAELYGLLTLLVNKSAIETAEDWAAR
jgi:hypothetical protein